MRQKKEIILSGAYVALLSDIKKRLISARIKTARSVNKELIHLYWEIGKSIAEKQAQNNWGDGVVEKLSADLRKEFHNTFGLSVQNLWYMRKIYLEYKDKPILQQLVGELPWGHNILILSNVKDTKAREYYLRASAEMGWSRNVLLNQIKADAYRLSLKKKQHNFEKALPVHLAEQADESLKSVYNLDFLGVTKPILERDLEKRIVEKIKHFILELGSGFSFIGNQYRLELDGNEYFIDLLFFNRKLKCLVAIELKAGDFKPEYALRSTRNPVGVAEYKLTRKLPVGLKKYLPSEKDLIAQVSEEMKEK